MWKEFELPLLRNVPATIWIGLDWIGLDWIGLDWKWKMNENPWPENDL